jgi:hypothetical protein
VIRVNFAGGLGNQLFQYAAGRSLMGKWDILLFGLSDYEKDYAIRSFALFNYKVKGSALGSSFINKLFIPGTKANRCLSNLGLFKELTETAFFIDSDLAGKCKVVTILEGYWQSEIYFAHIRTQLLKELQPMKLPLMPEIVKRPNTVAIHVRRGDYLHDLRYGFLGVNYYKNALYVIKQKVNDPLFLIFSDDPDWCKEFFINENIFFFDQAHWQKDHLQLYLMSKCSHQIIANSSFSWWGAWLNQNENKVVLRPDQPFKDKTLFYENYYPKDWIVIETGFN